MSASQGTSAEKSSWFGKKSTLGDTFWKSVESNLTKFVAGDEATEDPGAVSMARKQSQVEDPRFGRIASDTNLNRMASLPNLRYQATTPIYGSFPQDFRSPGASTAHSRYSTNNSESRYTPGARHEQVPVQAVQDYDGGVTINRPDSGFGTPEPVNTGYVQPVQFGYSPYVPTPPAPAPMAPPAPQWEITEPYSEPEPQKELEPAPEIKEEPKKEDDHKGKTRTFLF